MSVTQTYGLKLPEDGDRETWWDDLEDNITQLDGHAHNGTNSAKIPVASLTKTTQAIANGDWAAAGDGTGRSKQTVTLSGSLNYDEVSIEFRETSTKEIIYLQAIRASATSYDLYINDSSLDVTAIYS